MNIIKIPYAKKCITDKRYSDQVYGTLLEYSDDRGIVDMTFVKIMESTGLSFPTAKKKINGLIEMGLIRQIDKSKYKIINITRGCEHIPLEILKKLNAEQEKDLISLYVILRRIWRTGNFTFKREEFKKHLKISSNIRIMELLQTLINLGLVEKKEMEIIYVNEDSDVVMFF